MHLLKYLFQFILTYLAICVPHLLAGNSSSGGANLFLDAQNPWFLTNVDKIRYCIRIDAEGFSSDEAAVERSIIGAFAYWRGEFNRVSAGLARPAHGHGRQDILRVACDGKEDIAFYFGFDALPEDQRKATDWSTHLALTMRTSYDEVNLRGRGYVFVSSDRGAHQLQSVSGIIERRWQHEGLLLRVLAHEVGHVMGLPHLGRGYDPVDADKDFMSSVYPEQIVKEQFFRGNLSTDPASIGHFMAPPESYKVCYLTPEVRELFNLPTAAVCLQVEFKNRNAKTIQLSWIDGDDRSYPHGIYDVNGEPGLTITWPISIRLNPKQVLYGNGSPSSPYLTLATIASYDFSISVTPHADEKSSGLPSLLMNFGRQEFSAVGTTREGIVKTLLWAH